MARHVDDIIHTAKDSEVTVFGEQRSVARKIGPVTPILTLRILAVLLVVLADKAVAVTPDRLKDPRPWIPDADVSGLFGTGRHFLSIFVINDGINSEHARAGAARFHWVEGRLRAAEETAILGLPPSVDDHSFLFSNHVVIPAPDLRLNRLTHRSHVLKMVIVLFRLLRSSFP